MVWGAAASQEAPKEGGITTSPSLPYVPSPLMSTQPSRSAKTALSCRHQCKTCLGCGAPQNKAVGLGGGSPLGGPPYVRSDPGTGYTPNCVQRPGPRYTREPRIPSFLRSPGPLPHSVSGRAGPTWGGVARGGGSGGWVVSVGRKLFRSSTSHKPACRRPRGATEACGRPSRGLGAQCCGPAASIMPRSTHMVELSF